MKFNVFIFFLLLSAVSSAQLVNEFDTLNYSFRMNSSIDSLDISGADYPSTFDGGIATYSPYGLSVDALFRNYTTPNFHPDRTFKEMQFSALPHLGFSYSFGGQGSQFLRARYEHAFSDSINLNIKYQRRSGIGSIRNANFSTDDLSVQFQRLGSFYSIQLEGGFNGSLVNHSGGVTTDTLIEDFGLDFSPVYKSNANSRNRTGSVKLRNYFDFNKDSINSIGLLTNHYYQIKNRIYSEVDTVSGIYDTIFIDDFSTRDQFNNASISNGAGIYFMNNFIYIDGVVDYAYRDYQNLGQHEYLSELSLSSLARIKLGQFRIKNNLNFNIAGRFNEYREEARLNYSSNKLDINASFLLEQKAATLLQRKYFSNTTNYASNGTELQGWMKLSGNAAYNFSSNLRVLLVGDFTSVNSVYEFNGAEWENIKANKTYASLALNTAFNYGVLNFHPRFVYSLSSDSLLPSYQASGRLFVKGKLFKDKKLEALFGVDLSYISGFNTKVYVPSMDTYDWSMTGADFSERTNVDAFVSFGISEFRFFFRYENIGYFWSKKENQVVSNYPIAGPRMRLGLTWDFFN